MNIKKMCCKIIDGLFSERIAEKIKMTINIWRRDWRMGYPFHPYSYCRQFSTVSDREILVRFSGLEQKSIADVQRYIATQQRNSISDYTCYFYLYEKLLTAEEIKRQTEYDKRTDQERKKYRIPQGIPFGGHEAFATYHGLLFCPELAKKYICGGIFIDAGACYGDSALMLLKHFSPRKVWSFEPSASNRKIYAEIMKYNGASPDSYELAACALGGDNRIVSFRETAGGANSLKNTEQADTTVQCMKLDDFCKKHDISNVKFIKADVEGMGLEMLLGAEETIRKNRPVLSLSIYHNQEELFGIYETLRKWDLNYHCIIRLLSAYIGELSLIAWPCELDQTEMQGND